MIKWVFFLLLSLSVPTIAQDDEEQYSRRYCLRLQNIEKYQGETSSDCVKKVVNICRDLNLDINEQDIDRAHRIGKDRKGMIVKFYSFLKRTSLYKARKEMQNSLFRHY